MTENLAPFSKPQCGDTFARVGFRAENRRTDLVATARPSHRYSLLLPD